jgi:hypothetical protein
VPVASAEWRSVLTQALFLRACFAKTRCDVLDGGSHARNRPHQHVDVCRREGRADAAYLAADRVAGQHVFNPYTLPQKITSSSNIRWTQFCLLWKINLLKGAETNSKTQLQSFVAQLNAVTADNERGSASFTTMSSCWKDETIVKFRKL